MLVLPILLPTLFAVHLAAAMEAFEVPFRRSFAKFSPVLRGTYGPLEVGLRVELLLTKKGVLRGVKLRLSAPFEPGANVFHVFAPLGSDGRIERDELERAVLQAIHMAEVERRFRDGERELAHLPDVELATLIEDTHEKNWVCGFRHDPDTWVLHQVALKEREARQNESALCRIRHVKQAEVLAERRAREVEVARAWWNGLEIYQQSYRRPSTRAGLPEEDVIVLAYRARQREAHRQIVERLQSLHREQALYATIGMAPCSMSALLPAPGAAEVPELAEGLDEAAQAA